MQLRKIITSKLSSILLLASLAFVVVGCSPGEDLKNQEVKKEVPVQVALAKEGNLELNKEISGRLKAKTELSVLPKTAGQILEISVKKGDKVAKGQVLAKLDMRDQTTLLEMEKVALQQAKNQLETAMGSERVAANNLENAKANLVAAETTSQSQGQGTSVTVASETSRIQWEDAKKNRERMEVLYEAGAVSLAEYERAISQEKTAELSFIGSKATALNVANAEENLNQAQIGVKQAQIAVRQSELRLKQASDRVKDGVIRAPESGEVASLNGKKGEMTSNQAPFATIVSADLITFEAQISADQLKLFYIGDELKVKVATINQEVNATISFVAPAASQGGLYTIEAVIDNSEGNFKSGMVATIVAKEIKAEDTIIIPTEAIVDKGGETFVYVVKGNKASKKMVKVLQSQTSLSAVAGDVAANDKLVIKGQNTLDDGNMVKIIKGAQ